MCAEASDRPRAWDEGKVKLTGAEIKTYPSLVARLEASFGTKSGRSGNRGQRGQAKDEDRQASSSGNIPPTTD